MGARDAMRFRQFGPTLRSCRARLKSRRRGLQILTRERDLVEDRIDRYVRSLKWGRPSAEAEQADTREESFARADAGNNSSVATRWSKKGYTRRDRTSWCGRAGDGSSRVRVDAHTRVMVELVARARCSWWPWTPCWCSTSCSCFSCSSSGSPASCTTCRVLGRIPSHRMRSSRRGRRRAMTHRSTMCKVGVCRCVRERRGSHVTRGVADYTRSRSSERDIA